MAVTHEASVRNGVADYVVDRLDIGAGANGTLVYLTSGDVEVATLQMTAKATGAFGAASGGVATANAITDDNDATGGVIAKASLNDCDNTARLFCSVTGLGGGGDIELSNVTIPAGSTVTTSSLTYTAPL